MILPGIRKIIRNYFGFSKVETNGFVVLMFIMLGTIFMPSVIKGVVKSPGINSSEIVKLDSLVKALEQITEVKVTPPTYFRFNPNTVSEEELGKLGIKENIARRIINFRKSGARFKEKSDLKKIYGISDRQYQVLEPYIVLPKKLNPIKKTNTPQVFTMDANKADSTQFKRIRGIGNVLSARIVKYRDILGGFINLNQLKEIYGISDFALENTGKTLFIAKEFIPRQISVNGASDRELASHPYISYKQAKLIVAYRLQHGPYNTILEISGLELINDVDFNRISPYLSL
ncbi:MAG: helix-hairpin-helix domain-containing protein [Ignavibacteria bacterium]|nr:helix-hairpin-helix domain-containing protein [Ignavibacteria bacterium]